MSPWLRASYAAAGKMAELLAAITPTTSSSKLAKTFAARRGLTERYSSWGDQYRDVSRPLLWVHAPSVGEGLMALPVIQRVREEIPTAQLAYTFFSPSAARFAEQLGADFSAYLPFDTVLAAERIVTALRPTAIVFSKLDVWPVLVERAHQSGVHLGLMSASMPAQSARHGIGSMITRDAYATLDWIGAASTDDAAHLISAGARPTHVHVTGDTRYDQAWTRAHVHPQNASVVDALKSDRFTIVAGSTWQADEAHLLPAWEHLLAHLPTARLIVAPHEPGEKHLLRVEAWAQRTKISCARLSSAASRTADVVLIDRVGLLADLYVVANVAYVGGGFHNAGLHSVVEPAVLQIPVIIGPRHAASRDARLMLDAGGAVAVNDTNAMGETLQRLSSNPEARHQMSTALEAVVSTQRGATARSFAIVRAWLTGQ